MAKGGSARLRGPVKPLDKSKYVNKSVEPAQTAFTTMKKNMVLSTADLKEHPNLTAVDGTLYDLEAFSTVHPGGSHILGAGGYDSSALFHSMHPGRNPASSRLFQNFAVGVHARDATQGDLIYTFNSPFAVDMRRSVQSVMGTTSWYAPWTFWLRTFLILSLTLGSEWLWATTGLVSWGVLVGILHAQIGLSVQHDASHGALSSRPWINALFAYGADWIGHSRWIWFQQHILWHHPHTNHYGLDADATSAEPLVLMHDYKSPAAGGGETWEGGHARKWFHAFQHWFLHPVLSLYGPSTVYGPHVYTMRHNDNIPKSVSDGPFMNKQKACAWAMRGAYFLRIVVAPWLLASASLLTSLFLVNLVTGFCLTFLFVVSHNFEHSDREPCADPTDPNNMCWAKSQVETSCSYGGQVPMLLTGGLNLQIEHHLFPRMSSWHYPRIQQAVRDCCERHGVRYTYFPSLSSNVASMLKYVRQVGVGPVLKHALD